MINRDQMIDQSILTILDSKGEVLFNIPKKISEDDVILDFNAEELFELIAKQTRAYNGEQIAKENESLQSTWKCPRRHSVGMNSCDYCDGFLDGLEVSANKARGRK